MSNEQISENSSMIDVLKEVEELLELYENLEDVAGYKMSPYYHGERMDRIERCKRAVKFKLDEMSTDEHDAKLDARKQK